MSTEVNGQKQSPPAEEASPAEPTAAASDALEAKVGDLLAASEQAASAIRQRANGDVAALTQTASEADLARSREQLPRLETSVSKLGELLKELRAEVDQLRAELIPPGERPPSPDPAKLPPQFDRRALLLLLNMASNGASRSEAAEYLAENLNLRDCDELLGAVYGYVASTRPGPAEAKP